MLLLLIFHIVAAVTQRDYYNAAGKGVVPINYQISFNQMIRRQLTPYNIKPLTNENACEMVKIQLYYECLCPDCRDFDSKQFKEAVVKLATNLDVYVYPYGNAKTVEKDGHTEFECQHGPKECYGNKLHACAIDYLQSITTAVCYNSCMMDSSQVGEGSDDAAADACGHSMNINSEPIKECAKGDKGTQLLKYYGEESKKANIMDVPHVLINGVTSDGDHFMQDVCKAFKDPPAACNGVLE